MEVTKPGIYKVSWEGKEGKIGGIFRVEADCKNMTEAKLYNRFGGTIPIPDGAIFNVLTEEQKNTVYKEPHPRPNYDALEIDLWTQFCYHGCLRVKDILKLNTGDKIPILRLDDKTIDNIHEFNSGNKLYDPKEFFRYQYALYTHKSGFSGTLNIYTNGIHRNPSFVIDNLNLLVEKDGKWDLPTNIHECNGHNRVGWNNGSLYPWNNLTNMPLIWWYDYKL